MSVVLRRQFFIFCDEITLDKSTCFAGPRLMEYEEYLLAAKVFVCADMMKEAIDAFIAGDYWSKARKLASELDSS